MSKKAKVDPKTPVTAEVEEEEVGPDPELVGISLGCINENAVKMQVL
jgi:hypothetical protein